MPEKIAVLGAGSWGIAIANLLHENKHEVTLWEFNPDDYKQLIEHRTHAKKLPGIMIPEGIHLSNNLIETVENNKLIVIITPAQTVRTVCQNMSASITPEHRLVTLSKGIEVGSLLRMSQLVAETIPLSDCSRIASLSGPSHAEEVSRNLPTSVVIASDNIELAGELQKIFSNNYFRAYRSNDIIGVELGGSLKNVIAIASGILQGLGFGDNTSGALLTRGLAEITRISIKMGADPATLSGLSGIGDLVTTCLSRHSRNRHVGERIGKGETLSDILNSMVMVAEGVETCRSAYALSSKYDVEMPITKEVYQILFNNKPPREAVADLMGRSLKTEIWN